MNWRRQLRERIFRHYSKDISLYDESKVILLFNISSLLLILGLIATSVSLILQTYPILVPAVGNVLLALVTLFLLTRGKLQVAAAVYFTALWFLLFGNLNFNDGTMHVGSPFWVILLNILVIYISGIFWGTISLLCSFIGYTYYLIFVLPRSIDLIEQHPKEVYYSAVYEAAFALLLLFYILYTILQTSKRSDTLLKQKNKELQQQNALISQRDREKTVLLKEVHHRVKNNMQVVSSMLRIQAAGERSELLQDKINDSLERIQAMAIIHERLYKAEELSELDLSKYMEELTTALLPTYGENRDLKIELNSCTSGIGLKSIVPFALLYNELLSNSMKHAFGSNNHPQIVVTLKEGVDGVMLLYYSDNGNWKEPSNEHSFGLELIDSLVQQLDGTYERIINEKGTAYNFEFGSASR